VCALVDFEDRMRVRYADCRNTRHYKTKSRICILERTFRMESKIDSSDEEANLLIDKNAAIRILSDPLDHKSKHFWTIKKETTVQSNNSRLAASN
jgi:hypothetical protein